MTPFWLVLAAAFGGILIGYAFGKAWAMAELEKHRQIASNTTMAVLATTIELTYGEEFLTDLIEEAKVVMTDHKDLILNRAKFMTVLDVLKEDK